MLIDELITKSIAARNLPSVRALGINSFGLHSFRSSDLFKCGVDHPYRCVCDNCNAEFKYNKSKIKAVSDPELLVKLCGACRSAVAREQMKITVSTPEYKQKASETQRHLLATDEKFVAARSKAAQKRKDGWCKNGPR